MNRNDNRTLEQIQADVATCEDWERDRALAGWESRIHSPHVPACDRRGALAWVRAQRAAIRDGSAAHKRCSCDRYRPVHANPVRTGGWLTCARCDGRLD